MNEMTVRQISMASSDRYPITAPMTNTKLKAMISHTLMVMPLPPKDQALEYKATMVTRMVMNIISMTRPHSNVF